MRKAIGTLLILALGCNLPLFADSVKDQVSQMAPGALVEVRFVDNTRARGHLSGVQADGFSFRTGDAATGTVRQAAFGDVRSVKVIAPSHTPLAAWIATGVVIGVVVVVVAVFAIEKHNE